VQNITQCSRILKRRNVEIVQEGLEIVSWKRAFLRTAT
jgi:hypothetical protein